MKLSLRGPSVETTKIILTRSLWELRDMKFYLIEPITFDADQAPDGSYTEAVFWNDHGKRMTVSALTASIDVIKGTITIPGHTLWIALTEMCPSRTP